jgi:ferredoxin-thioredoxin reductase catalytic subunit
MGKADEAPKADILRRIEGFCRERGYVLSENSGPIIADLVRMYDLLGDFYCPCQVENTMETICICSAVKNRLVDEQGGCFCGLILRRNDT